MICYAESFSYGQPTDFYMPTEMVELGLATAISCTVEMQCQNGDLLTVQDTNNRAPMKNMATSGLYIDIEVSICHNLHRKQVNRSWCTPYDMLFPDLSIEHAFKFIIDFRSTQTH